MPGSRPLDPIASAAAIRERFAAGRTMSALREAKELAKRHPGPAADELLADAYAARIDDLVRSGMTGEARALVEVAAARFPESAARWRGRSLLVARKQGDLSDLVAALRAAGTEQERQRAADELAAHLRDPSALLKTPALPAGDPLAAGAAALAGALPDAARGALGAEARRRLQAIPRRSPLAPWRCFVLALDAFQRGDDVVCRSLLARVPDDQPVARGKQVLVQLLDGVPIEQPTPAQERLLHRLSGGAAGLLRTLDWLARPPRPDKTAAGRLRELVTGVASKDPRLGMRLVRLVLAGDAVSGASQVRQELCRDLGARLFGGREWQRLLVLQEGEDKSAFTAWLEWLVRPPGVLVPLADRELAVAIDRLLPHATGAWHECIDALGEEASSIGGGLQEVLATFAAELDRPALGRRRSCIETLLDWSALLDCLRKRTHLVVTWFHPVDVLALHAHALDPDPGRCAEYWRVLEGQLPERQQQWLDAWVAALPLDAEPWIQRALAAERRGALRQACDHFDKAEELAPVDERVRSARFRVLLAQLVRHHRKRARHLCARDLAQLAAVPAAALPARRQFLLAAGAIVGVGEDPFARLEAEVGGPRAVLARRLAARVLSGRGEPVAVDEGPLSERLLATGWLAGMAEAVAAPPGSVALPQDVAAARPQDLPADEATLLVLLRLARRHDAFAALLTAQGIAGQGPGVAAFLLARAALLGSGDRARAARCRRLARHLAERHGDQEVLRATRGEEPMQATTAAAWMAAERQLGAELPRARPRGGRSTRRRRPLLPWIDGVAGEDA